MRKNRLIGIILAACVIVAGIFIWHGTSAQSSTVQDGVTYLQTLETQNVDDVKDQINEQHKEEIAKQMQKQMQQKISDTAQNTKDVWSMFSDYVILGDSRAVGYYYYGFLPHERVLAEGGATIKDVDKHLQEMHALNPSTIYLCYGLNDVSIGYWKTPESYVSAFSDLLDKLKQEFPKATVVVSSILPARDPAFAKSAKWHEIPQYSAGVGKLCKEKGVAFANNDDISEKYAKLWDPDGIHVRKEFYPYWAASLLLAQTEAGSK